MRSVAHARIAAIATTLVIAACSEGDDDALGPTADNALVPTTVTESEVTRSSSTTSIRPVGDGHGDAAIWLTAADVPTVVDVASVPGELLDARSTTFTAYVVRLGCSDGETGQVLRPTIESSDTEVTVTFTVEPLPTNRDYTCPGNNAVPCEVTLDGPIGERTLVDGGCLPGAEAASTGLCENGAVRWPSP